MTLIVKPIGRGFRLRTTLRIAGGHMERGLTWAVGRIFILAALLLLTACGGQPSDDDGRAFVGPPDCRSNPEQCR